MRHFIHVVWLLPFLGVVALGADELPQPKKDPKAPPSAFPDLGPRPPGPVPPDANTAELQRLLRELRSQRESLRTERPGPQPDREAPATTTSANEQEIARLRKRMDELQKKARPRTDAGPSVVIPSDASPPTASAGGSIDPVAVAQNLFRAGDYEAALDAYRKVPLRGVTGEERAPTLYMIATCLRKLGKPDEAAKVYRDVAAIKDDPFVADCARWQLDNLTWRKEVEGQIAQLRQRRKALEPKP
ncbi:MAG TPA: tetratricopeptide repeat protein [Gemmataceae bacterium]|nr:tetratricopeptide repeat protein [Gemmataceae bacterium]